MRTQASSSRRAAALLVFAIGIAPAAGATSAPVAADRVAPDRVAAVALDRLIEKLDYARTRSRESRASWALSLRLADALAERARRQAMDEVRLGCGPCVAGQADRARALALYEAGGAEAPRAQRARLLLQVGHLNELEGRLPAASAAYAKAVAAAAEKGSADASVRRDSLLALAEMRFREGRFAEARPMYEELARGDVGGSRDLAAYRWAWCEFRANRPDRAASALSRLLLTPPKGVEIDAQFREAASRDLATFAAQTARPSDAFDGLWKASPERLRQENMIYLSEELGRLGRSGDARGALAWALRAARDPAAKADIWARDARLALDDGSPAALTSAGRDLASAAEILGGLPKSDALGAPANEAARDLLGAWAKREAGQKSSAALGAALDAFARAFPADRALGLAAAKAALDRSDYKGAFARYRALAQGGGADPEPALLGELDAAERAQDPASIDLACDDYLALSRARGRALEARYRKARLLYERGEHAKAADALRAVADSSEPGAGAAKLREQAADLSLDALALTQDHARLEAWSSEYARRFPARAAEFKELGRKAILHQSAALAAASADPRQALSALARFDVEGAAPAERVSYCKNRLILSEKAQRWTDASAAADCLLGEKSTSAADRDFALARKAWYAELALDFPAALAAVQRRSFDKPGEKAVKLAVLSELAGQDPKPHLARFLQEAPEAEGAPSAAARLARESADPLAEMARWSRALKRAPALRADLYLRAALGGPERRRAAAFKAGFADREAMATPGGASLKRAALWNEIQEARVRLEADSIDAGGSQRRLANALKARIADLERLERVAKKAVESGEWASQVLALDGVAAQSARFYDELIALPAPAGLSPEELTSYRALLAEQAAPHRERAEAARAKLGEFWKNDAAVASARALASASGSDSDPVKKIERERAQALLRLAPEGVRASIAGAPAAPAAPGRDVRPLREALRQDPLSRSRLEALLAAEREGGESTMTGYLEARLRALDAKPAAGAGGTKL